MRMVLSLVLALSAQPLPALSHEYWIEAQKFHPATAEELTADLRVGSDLSGEVFPWLKQSFATVTLTDAGTEPIILARLAANALTPQADRIAGLIPTLFTATDPDQTDGET